jgi:Cys-rich protein (TIGR01571 family)
MSNLEENGTEQQSNALELAMWVQAQQRQQQQQSNALDCARWVQQQQEVQEKEHQQQRNALELARWVQQQQAQQQAHQAQQHSEQPAADAATEREGACLPVATPCKRTYCEYCVFCGECCGGSCGVVSKQPQLTVVQGLPMTAAAISGVGIQTGHFSTGILSCFQNCFPSCITSCCCPCFAYAHVRSAAKLGGFKASLFIFSIVMLAHNIFKMMAHHGGHDGPMEHIGHHAHHGRSAPWWSLSLSSNSTNSDSGHGGHHGHHHDHKMKCCLFATLAVATFLIMNLLICRLRSGFRRTYGIKHESCCEDAAFSCLCPHLALAQMMRHTNPNPNPGCCDCSPNGSAVTDAPVATAILISGPVATNPLVSLV